MAKNYNTVSDLDTKEEKGTKAKNTSEIEAAKGGTSNYVYIGPSLPGASLKSNTVISGTKKQISEYYKDAFEQFPNAERLIVPTEKLSESREKIRNGGNILNKYYNDLLIQVKKGVVK